MVATALMSEPDSLGHPVPENFARRSWHYRSALPGKQLILSLAVVAGRS